MDTKKARGSDVGKKGGKDTKDMTVTSKADDSGFKDLQESRRVRDVSEARTLFNRFVHDNAARSRVMQQVRNQLEGGRPFDPADLERQGAAWQTNVNFGDSRAARDRTLVPYWKMVNDVPNKISVTIDTANPQNEKWQAAFQGAFDKFIDDWDDDYFIQFMNFASNFVNFGPGAVQWLDDRTPRWKAVNVARLYWPKNARMSPDEWDVVALERDMSASELWGRVRNDKEAKVSKAAGWDVDAVKAALVEARGAVNNSSASRGDDFTRVQDDFTNNDLSASCVYSPVSVVWLLMRTFEGKISCRVFTKVGMVDDFLFSHDSYAEDFRHLLGVVWYDTGADAMVHSIKGFGVKNHHFSVLINRLKSRLADSMNFSSGLIFQKENDLAPDETPSVETLGPVSVFPAGVKQLQVLPQTQGSVGVIGMLANNQMENNALYREQSKQISETDTATQAKLLASMQGEMTQASASMFLAQVGRNIFSEQVRRLRIKGSANRDAKRFQERLRDAGVPDEVIFSAEITVRAGANSGLANPMMRAMKFQQMLQMSTLPGVNQRWILEQYFTNELGAYGASKALVPEGAESNPQQRRAAILENIAFGQGQPLPVDQSDAHREHAEEHLKPIMQITQGYMQSGKIAPQQIQGTMIGLAHTGAHLQFLGADNTQKAAFKQLNDAFQSASSIMRGIMTRMQREQQAAAQGRAPNVGGIGGGAMMGVPGGGGGAGGPGGPPQGVPHPQGMRAMPRPMPQQMPPNMGGGGTANIVANVGGPQIPMPPQSMGMGM